MALAYKRKARCFRLNTSAGETSREKWRRRSLPLLTALALWLCWAIASGILIQLAPESGMLLSLLFLGGVASFGSALVLLHLRREFWRQRQQDLTQFQRTTDHVKDLIWLSSRISPRRPLPLRGGGWEARPQVLSAAWELIRDQRPKRVLELGSGLSSVVMAYALETNGSGQLQALENGIGYAEKTRRLLAEHDMHQRVQVLEAPLQQVEHEGERLLWYSLANLRADTSVDFLFVDGPAGTLGPMIRYPALPLLRGNLTDDAVILLDDTHREQERQVVQRWLEAFPDLRMDDDFANTDFTVLRFAGRNFE